MSNGVIKNVIAAVLFLAVSVSLVGCSFPAPGLTAKEVHRRHIDSYDTSIKQIQDDADAILMINRPSRLNEKITR